MKRVLKIGAVIIVLLVLVIMLGVVYILFFLNPDDLKPRIINTVRQKTGIELSLNGPLSWRFYPDLGVEARNVVVRMPDQDVHAPDLAHVEQAEFSVQILPLLSKHIAIKGIELDRPQFELYKDAQGHTNWQLRRHAQTDQLSHPTQMAKEKATTQTTTASPMHRRASAILVSRIRITRGAVHYVDETQHQAGHAAPLSVDIHDLNLNAFNVSLEHEFPLRLSFGTSFPSFQNGHVEVQTDVNANPAQGVYTLSHVELGGQGVFPSLNAHNDQHFSLRLPTLIADTAHKRYQVDHAHVQLDIYPSVLKGRGIPLSADLSMVTDLAAQTLVLPQLTVQSGDQWALKGHLDVSRLMTEPQYSGEVVLPQSNLHAWLQSIGVPLSSLPPEALSQVSGSFSLKGSRFGLSLTRIKGKVDDTPVDGQATLNLAASSYVVNLHTGPLDLDRYMSQPVVSGGHHERSHHGNESGAAHDHLDRQRPIANSSAPTTHSPVQQREHSKSAPFSFLQQNQLHGLVTIDALTVHHLGLHHVALDLTNDHGLIKLAQLSATGYGGHVNISGNADTRHMPLSLTVQSNVSSIALGDLLADVSPKIASRLDGTLNATGTFSTDGYDATDFQNNLSGHGQMNVIDGHLKGVDIPGQMCRATTLIRQHTLTHDLQGSTPIQQLNGTYVIQQGIITLNGVKASIPGFNVNGQGTVALPAHHFDFPLTLAFANNQTLTQCGVPSQLFKVRIPLHCDGNLSSAPAKWCHIDGRIIRQSLEQHVGGDVKQRLNKGIDKALDTKTGHRIKNALEGLFH